MQKNFRVTLRNSSNGTIYMEQFAGTLLEARQIASSLIVPNTLPGVVSTVIEHVLYEVID